MRVLRLWLSLLLLRPLLAQQQLPSLDRRKRYLVFPQGSNVQLVYCLTIGAYAKDGDLVIGLTAAIAWELPTKIDSKLAQLHRRSREALYPKIEAFLHSSGIDGRSCVLRAICEAGRRSSEEIGSGSFVQELLHAVFTMREDGSSWEREDSLEYERAQASRGSGSGDDDCARLYPSCEHSIYSLDF